MNKNDHDFYSYEEELRNIGFKECKENYLFLRRKVEFPKDDFYQDLSVSIFLAVSRNDHKFGAVAIEDDTNQVYDYEELLKYDPDFKIGQIVKAQMDDWVSKIKALKQESKQVSIRSFDILSVG